MKQDVVVIAALGALLAYALRAVRHARHEAMRPRAKPTELQRWEGEGGGVPTPPAASETPSETLRPPIAS